MVASCESMTQTSPLRLFVVEPVPTGWSFRHAKTGVAATKAFTTPEAALRAARKAEEVVLGRLTRSARARRSAAARKARDAFWRGCSKEDLGSIRWLPRREPGGEGDPDRPEGWYLVIDLAQAEVEVGVDYCPWCGGPLDPLAGPRGQNAFEIVARQPLRSFLSGEDKIDWPEDFDPGS